MGSDNPLILQVDDEEDVLALMKLALETIGGLDLVQCSSGLKAVEVAGETCPDLLLLDVMMPELDGIETLKRLRKIPELSHVPAIFLTAKATKEDREELMDCGAETVITKPFDTMSIASEIIGIWRESFQKLKPNTKST